MEYLIGGLRPQITVNMEAIQPLSVSTAPIRVKFRVQIESDTASNAPAIDEPAGKPNEHKFREMFWPCLPFRRTSDLCKKLPPSLEAEFIRKELRYGSTGHLKCHARR